MIEKGWSIKGTRCFGKKVFRHKRRISMIAGLCHKEIIAPFMYDGTINGSVFETYIKQVLLPELKPGQIVVMDNINFHKTEQIKHLIESSGCTIMFLPTYSPDLNPIEHFWFKIKNKIKRVRCVFKDIWNAIDYILSDS